MRKRKISGDRVITSVLVLLLVAGTSLRIASAGQSDAPPRGGAVYVRDFELAVASAAAPDPPSQAYRDKGPEHLQLRSRQVQDYFGETLVETLRKQGYSSSRNQALPGNGILLEGVFAEPDQKNRIRRALLGSGSRVASRFSSSITGNAPVPVPTTRRRHFHGIFSATDSGVCPNSARNFLEGFFLRLRTCPRSITTSCSQVTPSM